MKHARLTFAATLSLLIVFIASFGRPALVYSQVNLPVTPPEAALNGERGGLAYDDKHQVYLQVFEASRRTVGRFITAEGNLVGASFVIDTNSLSYGLQPTVAYSRGNAAVDQFLVIYVTDAHAFDSGAGLYGRMVRFTTTGSPLIGAPIPIAPNSTAPTAYQVPTKVVYNPVAQRFLVAYDDRNLGEAMVRHVLPDGSTPDLPVNLSAGPGGQGGGSVAFDWVRNRYFAIFIGDNPANPNLLGAFGYILDGTSAAPISQRIDIQGGFVIETGAVFLPERDGFLALYMAFTPSRDVVGRFVPSTQTAPALADPAYGVIASPSLNEGGPSAGYDYVSRKTFVVSMRDPKFIGGNTLDAFGNPELGGYTISTTNPLNGSYFPATIAAENARFGFAYLTDHNMAWMERVQFVPAATPGPFYSEGPCQTCPPAGGVTIEVDAPTQGQVITAPFNITGWAIDTRASVAPGVDWVHIWAVPQGNPSGAIFVGAATTGIGRPDVAQSMGAQYGSSGWNVTLSNIPPGTYTLVFYPHTAFTGNYDYDKVKTKVVTVVGGAITHIDTPSWGQTFGNGGVGMVVKGWALDLTNPNGTGIDAVHIWAVNATTGEATFLGGDSYHQLRDDVAGAYGDLRFLFSGFELANATPLPPGPHYILVYSHSVGAPAFNLARLVGVNIQ